MRSDEPKRVAVFLWLLFAATLGATAWFTTRGWNAPILDRHEFRQLQTALSAHWIGVEGWKLDYETPLFGPPWSIPFEFPLYQGIVGKLSAWLGWPLEQTGRGVSLFFLGATMPAVFALAGLLGFNPARRALIVSCVLATPTYLFYGRSFLIETTALCGAVWFLWGTAKAFERGDWRCATIAAAGAMAAALTKVTTFITFVPPTLALLLWLWRRAPGEVRLTPARLLWGGLPAAAAVVAGSWWVAHTDALKLTNPYSATLTSAHLSSWNWGTWAQRIAADHWREFWSNVSQFVLSPISLGLVALALVASARFARRVALLCAACFVTGALLFWNLYFFHDYYYCANALLLSFGAGVALAALWDHGRLPFVAKAGVCAAFLVSQFAAYTGTYGKVFRHAPPTPPPVAALLREIVPADGVVLIYGWDWSSTLPYYAQRRAITVPVGREQDQAALESILERLPPRRVAAMVINSDPLRSSPAFLRSKTDTLQLTPGPIATSPDGDVYLATDLLERARTVVAERTFAGVSVDLASAFSPPFAAGPAVDPAPLALPLFSAAPTAARAMFGVAPARLADRDILLANAPCELEFKAPAGARHVSATFGLLDEAWKSTDSATDGIGVEIFELLPDGQRRTHFLRQLDPANQPADRGPQQAEFTTASPLTGRLIFRFTTGLKENGAKDWSYWGEIRFR